MSIPLLYYYGSKGRPQLHKWIISHLPDDYEVYAEPFCGMLGVLVNRPKARVEIANDLNGRIINWFLVARDRGDELAEKIYWTPNSEKLFYDCFDSIDEGDELERAVKLQVVLTHSRMQSDAIRAFGYRKSKGSPKTYQAVLDKMHEIRDRLKHVTFLNQDAVELLDKYSKDTDKVIYCDPPYATADTTPYVVDDKLDMADVLKAQQSKVAISGYNDEWDELDWERHELDVPFAHGQKGEQPRRTEVLWTNYKTGSQLTF